MGRISSEKQNKSHRKDKVWSLIKNEAHLLLKREPILNGFFRSTMIDHDSLSGALSFILANKLGTVLVSETNLSEMINDVYLEDSSIVEAAACDIAAIVDRDPAVDLYSTPLLYLKGFHALQSFRIAHHLWNKGRRELAIYLQNQMSLVYQVDVHPAAKIGSGIMFDHATGIVIGETAIIEDDVSILQNVTLGGTGKESGKRHPIVRTGVLIGAGAKILGNIEIGVGAKIAAGSVVLHPVPSHTTVAGVPAKIVGRNGKKKPSLDMDQQFNACEKFFYGEGI